MRGCVIGTSNSAGSGSYARYFLDDPVFSSAMNRSVGFCCSDMFAFRKRDMDFSRHDICVLDFGANDAALLASGQASLENVQWAMTDALSEISKAACLPVLALLPVLGKNPDGGPLRKVYQKLSRRFGIPLFDGYSFLTRLVESHSRDGGYDLHKDRMHISNALSPSFGRGLALSMNRALASYQRIDKVEATKAYEYRYFTLGDSLMDRLPVKAWGTSMVAAEVVDIQQGAFYLALADEWEITAVAADFSRCRGTLEFAGSSSMRLRLTGKIFAENPEDKMVLGFYPLRSSVRPHRGTMRLILSKVEPVDGFVNGAPLPIPPETPAQAVIAGFTNRRRNVLTIVRPFDEGIDLVSLLDEGFFDGIRGTLGPAQDAVASGNITY